MKILLTLHDLGYLVFIPPPSSTKNGSDQFSRSTMYWRPKKLIKPTVSHQDKPNICIYKKKPQNRKTTLKQFRSTFYVATKQIPILVSYYITS